MARITINNVRLAEKEGSVKAFASIDINGVIEIYGCKLLDGKNGMFISMPQRKGTSKGVEKWFDDVRIKSDEIKNQATQAFIDAYMKTKSPASADGGIGGEEDTPF